MHHELKPVVMGPAKRRHALRFGFILLALGVLVLLAVVIVGLGVEGY